VEVAQSNHQGHEVTPRKSIEGLPSCDFVPLVVQEFAWDRENTIRSVKFKLRDFRREDFDTLWKLDQECFPEGIAYTRFELAAYMKRSGAFTLVAERESGILGFIVAEANKRRVGHIITIDILPAARRLGIASDLLRAAEDRLRAADCRAVRLESAVDNAGALAFYKRHQYELIKTLPGYYSTGLDAFALQKNLLSTAPEVTLLT
jgi:[ribosomal protein S18]-alanine N-acetyltransferase